DFAPITLVAHEPTLLVTHPAVPANTLAEFIAYARERPGKLSYGTDPGSAGFLAGELFKQTTGLTSIEYVAYKGSGPAAADAAAAKALQNEAVLARLATSGSLAIGAGPEQLDAHIRREIARWEKVLKAAGVELK